MRKTIIGLLVLLLTVSSAVGFGFRDRRGSALQRPGSIAVLYSVSLYPFVDVLDKKEKISILKQDINLNIPVWHSRGSMVSFSSRVSRTRISTDSVLEETTELFPEVLWNISAGINFMRQFSNRWIGSFSINLESAADEPFQRSDNFRLGVIGFLQIPVRNYRDCWRFSIIYSPFSDVQFPFLGIAYGWNPAHNIGFNLGIPFFVMWQMSEEISLNIFWIPVANIKANISYRLSDMISLYSGYETEIESFYLSDRTDFEERFLSYEKRLKVGASINIYQSMTLDLSSAYVFDKYYGKSDDMYGQIENPIDISSGILLKVGIGFR